MLKAAKAKAKSLKSSGESAYEYEPSFRDADSAYDSEEEGEQSIQEGADLSRRVSSYASSDDTDAHLAAADRALETLQDVHSKQSSAWKRALKHRSGTVVYYSKDKMPAGTKKRGKGDHLCPIYKGELDISGFTPAEVFGVVGSRQLWDDWYKEGNLVENLSETSSLTYMCMQGIAGSSTRDLSLVEKVAGSPTGTISFASTSVTTPKVPRVSGRVRASIALNGWVLEPINGGTRVTYYLLVNVRTFVPAALRKRYLARRPTCVSRIADYLAKNGAPPMAGVEELGQVPSNPSGGAGMAAIPRRRSSVSSKRSARSGSSSTVFAGLPSHVEVNKEVKSYAEAQKAIKLFRSLNDGGDWTLAVDQHQRKIWMRKREGDGLPIVKGEAVVEGVTTEQVLGTILSDTARREWDSRFASSTTLSQENGFDQSKLLECSKGIFPALSPRHYTITRHVDREDVTSANSTILVVSRSVASPLAGDFKEPASSTLGQLDLSGFLLTPLSDTSVKITHITQLDLRADKLTPTIRKILIAELAKTASSLAEFIDGEGHAPFFLRWGEGPATLLRTEDMRKGEVTFHLGGDGKGTMRDGQQKAWLQYSHKLYPRGVDISIVPEVGSLAKVDGCERTVEVVWSEKVREGRVKVVLKRADGDGSEDVYVGGEYLDRSVGMEKGSGAIKKAPAVAAAAVGARTTSEDARSSGSERTLVDDHLKSKSKGVSSPEIGAIGTSTRSASAPTSDPNSSAPALVGTKQGIPADACLILSESLYFTRSQVAFMGAVVVAAYAWGKFS